MWEGHYLTVFLNRKVDTIQGQRYCNNGVSDNNSDNNPFKFWEMPVLKYQIRNVVASDAHPRQAEMQNKLWVDNKPRCAVNSGHSTLLNILGQSLANPLQAVFGSLHVFGGCIFLYAPFFVQKLLHWNSIFFTAAWVFFQNLDIPGSVSNPLGVKLQKRERSIYHRRTWWQHIALEAPLFQFNTSLPVHSIAGTRHC